jgi:hypothetical protein
MPGCGRPPTEERIAAERYADSEPRMTSRKLASSALAPGVSGMSYRPAAPELVVLKSESRRQAAPDGGGSCLSLC